MFVIEVSSPPGRRQIGRVDLRLGQAADRVLDRPDDQEQHHRRARQQDRDEETLEAPVQQDRQADDAAHDEVASPDKGLDAEHALERLGLSEPARKRVPRARERSGERSADRSGDEEGQPPDRVRKDRLRQVDRRAVRGQADRALDEHEPERDPDEQAVAAGAALVEVDQDRERGRGRDPGGEPAQTQAGVERAERQEAFSQETGQPCV